MTQMKTTQLRFSLAALKGRGFKPRRKVAQ
jgi:hypothetical protein